MAPAGKLYATLLVVAAIAFTLAALLARSPDLEPLRGARFELDAPQATP